LLNQQFLLFQFELETGKPTYLILLTGRTPLLLLMVGGAGELAALEKGARSGGACNDRIPVITGWPEAGVEDLSAIPVLPVITCARMQKYHMFS
jgi:hypothetical protein